MTFSKNPCTQLGNPGKDNGILALKRVIKVKNCQEKGRISRVLSLRVFQGVGKPAKTIITETDES